MIARIAALVIDGMTIGLVSSVVLAMIDTVMLGTDALWPLFNPTIVSLPLGFLGTVNQLLI